MGEFGSLLVCSLVVVVVASTVEMPYYRWQVVLKVVETLVLVLVRSL